MWIFGQSGTNALLRKLKESVLFSPDFPKRERISHEKWALLKEEERHQATPAGKRAIELAKNRAELTQVIKDLGDSKHASAVPVLEQLWAECALVPVRNAAGHALRRIGTPAARSALLEQIDDHDHLSVFLAVRAIFDEHQVRAFDHCAVYFEVDRLVKPGGTVIPNEVLKTFAPNGLMGGKTATWTDERAPGWLKEDKRWLDLCARLRKHEELGITARQVLEYADEHAVKAALKGVLEKEGTKVVHTVTNAKGDLLSRYQRGDHEAVWKELRSYEALSGDCLDEAQAVASETMRRVAHNADLLAQRLEDRGWKALYESLRSKPLEEDDEVIGKIEEVAGCLLPVSLRAFWKVVGGINFVWDYDCGDDVPDLGVNLPMDELDPLCVHSPQAVVHQIDEWEAQRSGVDPELFDPLRIDLAPDYLHKANISGGEAYGIELPVYGADPIFASELHNLPFVDYLRLCFRWGAFTGLEKYQEREDVGEFLKVMRKGLEEF